MIDILIKEKNFVQKVVLTENILMKITPHDDVFQLIGNYPIKSVRGSPYLINLHAVYFKCVVDLMRLDGSVWYFDRVVGYFLLSVVTKIENYWFF